MLPNETNLDSLVTQQENDLDLKKFTEDPSNIESIHNHKKLKERISDLLKGDTEFFRMKQGDQALVVGTASGLFTALLPLLAVGVTLAIPGAIVGLTLYFAVKVAVKSVQSGYKGLKWSAEKTVEGAQYTAGKIKKGFINARDSLKEAGSSVAQKTREGTSDTLKKVGSKLGNLGSSISNLDSIPYSIDLQSQTVVLKTEEKTKNFNSVKEMLVSEVLQDKTINKSALIKEIFSELNRKISEKADSIDGPQGFKKDQLVYQLAQQAAFVDKLDTKKLQNLLAQDDNNLYEIFSEHHDEINRIIRECKIEHKLSNSIENLNKIASKCGESKKVSNVKYQVLAATPTATIGSRPEVTRRNSTGNFTNAFTPKVQNISASLTNLNGVMNSFSQSSLSEDVFNHPTVKRNLDILSNRTPTRSNSVSSLASNSSYFSAISTFSDIDDSIASKSSSFSDLSDSDSGRGASIPSTPERMIISSDDLITTRSQLRKVNSQEKIGEQQPSTFMYGQEPIQVTQSLQTSR
ncbi:MAG: actin-bundling T4SS effector WalE1 family protein [Wolbachia sp.]|uniref:actin-bundling T4SS effector WalE1 family protein n=1 Tax=unclassified Wolbachia TaxID=2640676 RepID=UPI00222E49AB|nr:hypothetical protein [Wolbachia endosymbiont (group A) of Calamotropha paludella]